MSKDLKPKQKLGQRRLSTRQRIAIWSALVERHGLDTLGYALLLLQRG